MKLYLDTEFNGHGGELLSMALVGAGGGWYAVRENACPFDAWVFANVVPKFGRKPEHPDFFRHSFHTFISKYVNPEIICDFHIDAAHFSQMLAGPDYASSLDFPYRMTVLKTPPGQPVSKNPHNALDDATALMEWCESREGRSWPKPAQPGSSSYLSLSASLAGRW